jgi:hypothetical protein
VFANFKIVPINFFWTISKSLCLVELQKHVDFNGIIIIIIISVFPRHYFAAALPIFILHFVLCVIINTFTRQKQRVWNIAELVFQRMYIIDTNLANEGISWIKNQKGLDFACLCRTEVLMLKIRLADEKKPKNLQATYFRSQYARTPSIFHRISLHTHRNTRRICFVLLGSDLFVKVRVVAGKSRKTYRHTMLPIVHTRPYLTYKVVCGLWCPVTHRGLKYLLLWSSMSTRSGHSRIQVRSCGTKTFLQCNSKEKYTKQSQHYYNPAPCVNKLVFRGQIK